MSVLYETYGNVAGWQDRSPPEPVSRRWPRHERRQRSLIFPRLRLAPIERMAGNGALAKLPSSRTVSSRSSLDQMLVPLARPPIGLDRRQARCPHLHWETMPQHLGYRFAPSAGAGYPLIVLLQPASAPPPLGLYQLPRLLYIAPLADVHFALCPELVPVANGVLMFQI
jgi:hypothetical protein